MTTAAVQSLGRLSTTSALKPTEALDRYARGLQRHSSTNSVVPASDDGRRPVVGYLEPWMLTKAAMPYFLKQKFG